MNLGYNVEPISVLVGWSVCSLAANPQCSLRGSFVRVSKVFPWNCLAKSNTLVHKSMLQLILNKLKIYFTVHHAKLLNIVYQSLGFIDERKVPWRVPYRHQTTDEDIYSQNTSIHHCYLSFRWKFWTSWILNCTFFPNKARRRLSLFSNIEKVLPCRQIPNTTFPSSNRKQANF